MGATTDFTGSPLEHLAGDGMYRHFRPLYNGHIIANVEMTQERGNSLIEEGLLIAVPPSFGKTLSYQRQWRITLYAENGTSPSIVFSRTHSLEYRFGHSGKTAVSEIYIEDRAPTEKLIFVT
jgi:hypothetical protein